MPHITWVHHWIIGTPFQYIAICLTFIGLYTIQDRRIVVRRRIFLGILTLLLLYRIVTFASTEKALWAGKSSDEWSPEYTHLAEFAAEHAKDAVFIAADWGFTSQIRCVGENAAPVCELFWSFNESDVKNVLVQTGRNEAYIIFRSLPTAIAPQNTARILPAMKKIEGWKEVALDPELLKLRLFRIYKFVK